MTNFSEVRKIAWSMLVVILGCGSLVVPVFAGEETTGDYMAGIGTKFGRGLLNVVTSPADIPCTMAQDTRESGSSVGLLTGFGKGTLFMLRRILVGATEVGTFMIPAERTIPPVCREQTFEN